MKINCKVKNVLKILYKSRFLKKAIPWIVLFGVVFFVYPGMNKEQDEGISVDRNVESAVPIEAPTESALSSPKEEKKIVVHVAGAVKRQGVVTLMDGARVFEAVEEAGGATSFAALSNINLAAVLQDEQRLYVPTKEECQNRTVAAASGLPWEEDQATNKKLDINEANSEELQQLVGIGPATAARILEYRNEHGAFKNIVDLKNVKGIGEKTFEKFENNICVN